MERDIQQLNDSNISESKRENNNVKDKVHKTIHDRHFKKRA